jgi:hypothetical protein
MTPDKVCKSLDEKITIEEQHVLRICGAITGCQRPSESYFEYIIGAIYCAFTGENNGQFTSLAGYLMQLAQIHPEYFHAVDCFINGNLSERYYHQQKIKELGY